MTKIKSVIFDLDGTIGDTLPLCIKAFRHAIEPLIHRSVSDAEIVATFGPSEEGTIMALAPDHYEKGIADYIHYYETFHNICPAPFEGIREMLEMLRKSSVHLALVTGKGARSADITLEKFDIGDYFEIIETGSPQGPRKPEGIRNSLALFGASPGPETIYVGDAPSDIQSSRQAGVSIVSAAWADTAEKETLLALQPDEIFYTIPSFRDWLFERI